MAEPGEFTLRAFLGGRLDLTQAEAVLGVIDASDTQDLHTALAQLAGGLARPLFQLRDDLLQLLAELEAGLDFVEDDIRFVSQAETVQRLQAAAATLSDAAEQISVRHTVRDVCDVVLVGPPNAGKSSLFNALVERYSGGKVATGCEATAIVSPIRGTTRDYLTATIRVEGVAIELVDTAGVEAVATVAASRIDAKAQSLAIERRERAQILVHCLPATELHQSDIPPGPDIIVITKSDLATTTRLTLNTHTPIVVTSSLTGEGLAKLCDKIVHLIAVRNQPGRPAAVAVTADRCRESIRLAAAAISTATELANSASGDELVAAELRSALTELGKVVGAVYTDDVLDRVFKTFCIGK
jgi:tRNA modification GTPase